MFPTRAYIQTFDGKLPPDYTHVAEELSGRGVQVLQFDTIEAALAHQPPPDSQCLVVGDFTWTKAALAALRVPLPTPPDYPECLTDLLYRRVGQGTLGDMPDLVAAAQQKNARIFIKPAAEGKLFSAIIEPTDGMLDCLLQGIPGVVKALPPTTAVHWADVVEMKAEYRVYVVRGAIRSVAHYLTKGEKEEQGELDLKVVETAIKTFCGSPEGHGVAEGCGIDFATMNVCPAGSDAPETVTGLVEVNDGYSLGKYDQLSGKDYTDLLVARWESLMQSAHDV